jgi:hypothetical protein
LSLAERAVDLVGYAGASIVAVPLAKISIDAVVDVVKERFSEAQDEAFVKMRRIAETGKLFLKHKKHIVMAFAHPTKSPTLVQALRATQRPGEKFSFFDIVRLRDVHLIFADAKNFKTAFQHLVLRQDAGQTCREDISVMLADEFEEAPRVMRFLKDGSSVAVWYEHGAPVFSATWDKDGRIVEDLTALPDGIEMPDRQDVFNAFQRAVLSYAPVVPINLEKLGDKHRLDIDQEGNPLVVPVSSNVTTIRSAAHFADPSGELNIENDEIVKFPTNRI